MGDFTGIDELIDEVLLQIQQVTHLDYGEISIILFHVAIHFIFLVTG